MTNQVQPNKSLLLGSFFLMFAVVIGAFGAHALKSTVSPDKLATFETGVRYHFYHGFGLVIIGLLNQQFSALKLNVVHYSFLVGILLFSFNCYFYVLSGLKIYAMLVPLGGVLFILGWSLLFLKLLKLR